TRLRLSFAFDISNPTHLFIRLHIRIRQVAQEVHLRIILYFPGRSMPRRSASGTEKSAHSSRHTRAKSYPFSIKSSGVSPKVDTTCECAIHLPCGEPNTSCSSCSNSVNRMWTSSRSTTKRLLKHRSKDGFASNNNFALQ